MPTLENSLRCLRHPITLLCIGLLLVNDHILKIVAPSWLTGKLSDFAGLFFFPFLLVVGLSLILRRASAQTIGAISFGITAIWFTLIKTTVWGNALTEEFIARLLGAPVQIILDPTDVIALVVLLPAWRLWHRAQVARPTRLSWVALGVAALATVATSPCPTPARVDRIVYADDILYAHYSSVYRNAPSIWDNTHYTFSKDYGRKWNGIFDYATQTYRDVPDAVKSAINLPIIQCSNQNSQTCYRISIQDQVDESNDGGKTWRVAWRIPPGRRYYMQRVADLGWCSRLVDPGPYDLMLLEMPEAMVIVALGTEGLLIRSNTGEWRQVSFFNQLPLPYSAKNFQEAIDVISREVSVAIWVASFMLLILSAHCARMLKNMWLQLHSSTWRSLLPLLIAFILMSIVMIAWYNSPLSMVSSPSVLAIVFAVPIVVIAFIATWTSMAPLVTWSDPIWSSAQLTFLTALGVAILITSVFVLWAFSIIAEYTIAVLIALLGSLFLAVHAYYRIGEIVSREQTTA